MTMLLAVALRGSALLLAGLLVALALRRGAPAVRHAALAASLAAALLVAPLGQVLPALVIPWPGAHATPQATSADDAGPSGAVVARADVASAVRHAPASETRDGMDAVRRVLPAAWVLGSCLSLGLLLLSLLRMAADTRRAAVLADPRWNEALGAAAREAGLRRMPRLLESPRAGLLATWGWRRPCVLVPAAARTWPASRVALVAAHEVAHIARADWIWQVLAAVTRAVFWWNPLAWLACRQLSLEGERACDDVVLARGVDPRVYAADLVAIARVLHVPSSPVGAVAVPMARPSTLHRRISAMLDQRRSRTTPRRASLVMAIGLVAALLVPVAAMRSAAQAPLEGVVYDPTGAVVPEVKLVLTGAGRSIDATTDAEGRFVFAGVEPGTYELEGKRPGFRTVKQGLALKDPADWTRVITLQLGTVQETIRVSSRRAAAPPAPTGPVPIRVGGNIRPPRKLKDVKPIYPDSMREAGREGVVTIDAVIGRDGSVTTAHVTSADVHPDLAIAALDAVRQWKFAPTLLNGNPVDVVMSVSISFTLE